MIVADFYQKVFLSYSNSVKPLGEILCEGHICVQYVEVNASFHILIITQPYSMIT